MAASIDGSPYASYAYGREVMAGMDAARPRGDDAGAITNAPRRARPDAAQRGPRGEGAPPQAAAAAPQPMAAAISPAGASVGGGAAFMAQLLSQQQLPANDNGAQGAGQGARAYAAAAAGGAAPAGNEGEILLPPRLASGHALDLVV